MEERAMYKPLEFSQSVNLTGRCSHWSVSLTLDAKCKQGPLSVFLTIPVKLLEVAVIVEVRFFLYLV
eukprot:2826031-Amphidinium_carterae.1